MPSIDDLMAASKRQSIIDTILGGLSNAAERSIVKPARRVFDALTVPGYMQDADGPAALMTRRAQEIQRGVMPSQSDPGLRDAMQKNAIDMGLALQTVYHGSPHKFDRFDMSKVGTGEGAQAYGHGLYTAGSENLGNVYRRKLTGVDGSPVSHPDQSLQVKIGNLANEIKRLEQSGDASAPAMIKAYQKRIAELDQGGYLYKVDLPDEHIAKMLDWDAPLSQQPHILPQGVTVADFVASIKGRRPTELEKMQVNLLGRVDRGELDPNYATGRNIYEGRNITQYPSPADYSKKLRELGIPGIKYLDGGSRTAGEGTRNFVVFDDKIPKILGRE